MNIDKETTKCQAKGMSIARDDSRRCDYICAKEAFDYDELNCNDSYPSCGGNQPHFFKVKPWRLSAIVYRLIWS